MINKLINVDKIAEKLLKLSLGNVSRSLESRLENPINYRGEAEPINPIYIGDKPFYIVKDIPEFNKVIIGVDGSSRVIDTAYAFFAIATVTSYSRILGEILDHPPLPAYYILPPLNNPFIAISIDVKPGIEFKGDKYVTTTSPAGVPYTPDYNKALILDEIRTSLEISMLKQIGLHSDMIQKGGNEFIIFIDGPVYPVPNLFRQHYNLLVRGSPSRGRLDDYVASWRELLRNRFQALQILEGRNIPVVGIVKRLESSRLLLSSINYRNLLSEIGISIGDLGNDQAFIDTIIRTLIKKKHILQPYYPIIIGPIKVPAESTFLDKYLENVPSKYIYYIAIPVNRYGESRIIYTLYRVETTERSFSILENYGIEPTIPALADSIGSGTTIPLSILYADKRSKGISRSLANILARNLEAYGIPLTYDTIRTIEAYSIE